MSARVFLHGFTGGPGSFDALRRALPDPQGLAPALVGHGPRPWARSFDEELERLAALIAEAAPVTLVGYSLGGRLALSLACRRPELVARVVAIGASAGLASEAEREARRRDDARWTRVLREEGLGVFLAAWEAQPLFATQRGASAAALAAQAALRAAHDPEGLAVSLEVCGLGAMPPLHDALRALSVPVELVVGGADSKFLSIAEALAPTLPDARLHVVEGAGHNLLLEAPARLVRVIEA